MVIYTDYLNKNSKGNVIVLKHHLTPGRVAQSVTCLATDACLTAADCRSRGREFDPGPVPYFRGD